MVAHDNCTSDSKDNAVKHESNNKGIIKVAQHAVITHVKTNNIYAAIIIYFDETAMYWSS